MSAQGQLVDPVMALAQQGAGPIDPVQALAMEHPISIPTPAPAAPQTGGLDSFVRNAANAATFNMADPLAAAADAALPFMNDKSSHAADWKQRFTENLAAQRSLTNTEQQQNPGASITGTIAGGIANPINRLLPNPASLTGAVAQGAGLGAAYGAGGSIGNSKSLGDALSQTGTGALYGAGGGAAARVLGSALAGATRSPNAQLLANEGVPLTIGQGLGGTAHTLEDASTHIPMLGNAIKGRQGDAIEGFNRATYNRVLEPLGVSYAGDGPVGNEGIQKIDDLIGKAYTKAYTGATVQNSPSFAGNISNAIDEASNVLPKEQLETVTKNVNRLINGKFDQNGQLSNDDLINAKNWFAEQSRAGPTASLDERATAKTYGSIVDALKDGIAETDPDKGALLNAADTAYMRFVKVSQAASQNAASAKGGVFTPNQFGAALRATEQSTRRMNFAKGAAPMQDLAQAGQAVLPSTVPDSGTALRGLLELGAGGAITHEISPEAAMLGAGAVGGGAALYSRPGQAIGRALLHGAPNARKAIGKIPASLLPGLLAAQGNNQ